MAPISLYHGTFLSPRIICTEGLTLPRKRVERELMEYFGIDTLPSLITNKIAPEIYFSTVFDTAKMYANNSMNAMKLHGRSSESFDLIREAVCTKPSSHQLENYEKHDESWGIFDDTPEMYLWGKNNHVNCQDPIFPHDSSKEFEPIIVEVTLTPAIRSFASGEIMPNDDDFAIHDRSISPKEIDRIHFLNTHTSKTCHNILNK